VGVHEFGVIVSVAKKFLPASIVGALIVAGAIALPLQAQALTLPDVTADELVAMMDVEVTGFSGTVTKTTDLGLPAMELSSLATPEIVEQMAERMPDGFDDFIPQIIEQNVVTEAIAFLAGTDTIRVYASEEGFRAQILDPMSQRDIIVTKNQFWSYNAKTQTAITRTTTATVSDEDIQRLLSDVQVDVSDPRAVAEFLLAEAGPDTAIRVGDDHRVAGRTAYRLILEPNSDISLVSSIQVSVDSENGMPLAVNIYSTNQSTPAATVAFSSLRFEEPDASLFAFTPPPGTTVETLELPEAIEQAIADGERGTLTTESAQDRFEAVVEQFAPGATVTTVGERWESVVSLTTLPAEAPTDVLDTELFQDLMVPVTGGQVFSTPLFNILFTDGGGVFAGAVTIDHLVQLAAR
jgi:outer membrane lipoprotein-sorting protein